MAYPINTASTPEFPEPLLIYESMTQNSSSIVAGEPYPPSMNGFALTASQSTLFRDQIPPFAF